MWERSVFDAVFNLIGAIRDKPTTIADVAKYYEAEVRYVISVCLATGVRGHSSFARTSILQ